MPAPGERARAAALALLVAAVAFLPFLRGTLAGACLYFRDLSLHFFPLRLFALEGLRQGELRLWNPYVHEGVPLTLPALGYPLDALGLLAPSAPVLSLLLALHVPLGALFFLLLARGLGLSREAAAGGALAYALGGFSLSAVNLYVYVQAAAWAPLVVLGLVRVLSGGGRRALALAALAVAVALSTTGVEVVAQAVAAGVLVGWRGRQPLAAASRLGAVLVLAAALAAPVLALVGGQVEGSARGQGFAADVVLAHSVHPFALVQSVVAGLFGNPANLANEWWGENFFPRGFPYVLSLYLGAALLALAATGAASRRAPSARLVVLAGLGLAVALGRWGVIGPLVEAVPQLRLFRFPVKAWFTVHLAVALLAALGVQQLVEGRGRRTLAALGAALGSLLLAAPLLPLLFPGPLRSFAAAFLPEGFAPEARAAVMGFVLRDAAVGGALALALALVALLARSGHLAGTRPAWLAVTLVAADLLRTGAGLNPMVSRAFYEPSPALAERLPTLRTGRVYTCPIETSAAYARGRLARGREHELWSFALLAETLSPSFNVPRHVPTALSPDLTMLVPTERTLAPEAGRCTNDLPRLLPRLREAAVTTVLSLDPLDDPALQPIFVLGGPRTDPVAVHAYALADAPPRIGLSGPGEVRAVGDRAGGLELLVDSDGPATLQVRDALAPGWRVEVNGAPASFEPLRRHRAVAVPAGRSRVRMEYRPPGLAAAALTSALALLLLAAALLPWRRRAALVALLALVPGGAAAQDPAGSVPGPPSLRVADIPLARFEPDGPPRAPLLRRAVDLLQLAWTGQGTASEPAGADRTLAAGVSVSALPWPAPEPARFTLRRFSEHVEEGTLSLQLWSGAEWCTPPLELGPGSRLRLDALAVGREPSARLLVRFDRGPGAEWRTTALAERPDTPGSRGLDQALPAGRGRLCLRAEGGAISLGEPRVVEPEPPGSDPRPRFVVLTVCDALRGDILGHPQGERLAPSLEALSRRAQRYERAVSTGAHTQAALLPLLLGRDLARVDPVRARRFTPAGTPLGLLYARGNLALSHLAQAAGYHSVFLGNNSFLLDAPLFARFSNRGRPDTGTRDTIAALAPTLRRYADERVLLVYYLSTPHNYSYAPRRLFERFRCGTLAGVAAERCAYDARVAHADEAILALLQGLRHHALEASTLHVVTADHGEVFGDGRALEAEIFSQWYGLDAGHGGATHWRELHVPLLVAGPGVAAASWPGRVSTLDVVPTLAQLLDLPTPLRLDGAVLPLVGGPRAERSITSHGYCSDSVLEGRSQLVWWEAECARRRERGSATELRHRAEVWKDGALEATDASDPGRVRPLVRSHLEWLAERLPGEAWVVDGARLGAASLTLTVETGRIADWGPTMGPARLAALRTRLENDGRRLRIDFRDDDPGLVYVSTWPADAPVRFEVERRGGSAPATSFVGALQLPLAVAGRRVAPGEHPELWRSGGEPPRQPSRAPHWRVWRQPYRPEARPGAAPSVSEMDRVLREWGYIR